MRLNIGFFVAKTRNLLHCLAKPFYRWLNKKYDNKKLPSPIINKTAADILNEKINKISIIIPTRNRLDALKKYSLKSLEKIRFAELPYEIIIIDNNSSDGTYDYLIEYSKNKTCKFENCF